MSIGSDREFFYDAFRIHPGLLEVAYHLTGRSLRRSIRGSDLHGMILGQILSDSLDIRRNLTILKLGEPGSVFMHMLPRFSRVPGELLQETERLGHSIARSYRVYAQ